MSLLEAVGQGRPFWLGQAGDDPGEHQVSGFAIVSGEAGAVEDYICQ